VVTPWIAAHLGWNASFLAAAAMCVVGSLVWLAVDPERKPYVPVPSRDREGAASRE